MKTDLEKLANTLDVALERISKLDEKDYLLFIMNFQPGFIKILQDKEKAYAEIAFKQLITDADKEKINLKEFEKKFNSSISNLGKTVTFDKFPAKKKESPKIKVKYVYSWFGYTYIMPGMHPAQNTRVDQCENFDEFKKEVAKRNNANLDSLEFIEDQLLLF